MKKLLIVCVLFFTACAGDPIIFPNENLDDSGNPLNPDGGGGGGSTSYCQISFSDMVDDWITSVRLNGATRNSSAEGYVNVGGVFANLTRSTTNLVAVDIYVRSSFTQYCRVWIDFNRDFVFSTSEMIDLGATPGTSGIHTLSRSFTVPSSALPGLTRMRVAERFSLAPDACGSFTYGEAEDYQINIQ